MQKARRLEGEKVGRREGWKARRLEGEKVGRRQKRKKRMKEGAVNWHTTD
jgi:hypothetical protein